VKPADYAVIDKLAADGVGADYITIVHRARPCGQRAEDDRVHQEEAADTFVIAGTSRRRRR